MSKRTNSLNPALSYSTIESAYSTGVMPPQYPTSGTRYDINLGGLSDNENFATLVVDSNQRNYDIYPNPNEYTLKLDPPYKEVVSVELAMADIPNSGYVIDTSHNLIYFQDTAGQVANNTVLIAEVPIGNRDINNICSNIATAMINASAGTGGAGAEYTCTANQYTGLVTIAQSDPGISNNVFNLLFMGIREKTDPPNYKTNGVYSGRYRTLYKTRSIGKVIGFERIDYTGSLTYTGTYTYDLKPYKYIALFINNKLTEGSFNRVDATNSTIKGAFCVIPLNKESSNFDFEKNFDGRDNSRLIKYFTEPVPELNELCIKFIDADGNLFNFTGRDHTMVFEIRCNTRRGMFLENNSSGKRR